MAWRRLGRLVGLGLIGREGSWCRQRVLERGVFSPLQSPVQLGPLSRAPRPGQRKKKKNEKKKEREEKRKKKEKKKEEEIEMSFNEYVFKHSNNCSKL